MSDRLSTLSVRELVERLSSSAPIPGGGSAAALSGAMAAALVHMVVELTAGRPAAAGHEPTLETVRADAARLRDALLDLAEDDAVAYDAVVAARRLPKETDPQRATRAARIAGATRGATEAPLRTARAAADVLALAETLAPIGNRNAISDAGVAGLLASAAIRGAALNVRINLPYLAPDDALGPAAASEIELLVRGLEERERALRTAVEDRLG
jgi:formiminotetrahydrofolate cyclodeaminase